ncbi:hypothetical protein NCCP28_13880 [Niallia sp. NCCP-28]|nr:hypothetical protein NCCP28_13880 [Niallia sp. NCCP-28]
MTIRKEFKYAMKEKPKNTLKYKQKTNKYGDMSIRINGNNEMMKIGIILLGFAAAIFNVLPIDSFIEFSNLEIYGNINTVIIR